MNRLELLIILVVSVSLIIWLLKSAWFDRQLNRLLAKPGDNADEIEKQVAAVAAQKAAVEKNLRTKQELLKQEQEKMEKINL